MRLQRETSGTLDEYMIDFGYLGLLKPGCVCMCICVLQVLDDAC